MYIHLHCPYKHPLLRPPHLHLDQKNILLLQLNTINIDAHILHHTEITNQTGIAILHTLNCYFSSMNINLRISQERWQCCFLYLGWCIETHCIDTFQKLRLSKKNILQHTVSAAEKTISTFHFTNIC